MKTCAGSITFTLMACRQENLNCTKGGQKHDTLAEHKSYNALLNAELLLFWRTLLEQFLYHPNLQHLFSLFYVLTSFYLFLSLTHQVHHACWSCDCAFDRSYSFFFPLETQWPPCTFSQMPPSHFFMQERVWVKSKQWNMELRISILSRGIL
jgi:hypothetical protein